MLGANPRLGIFNIKGQLDKMYEYRVTYYEDYNNTICQDTHRARSKRQIRRLYRLWNRSGQVISIQKLKRTTR